MMKNLGKSIGFLFTFQIIIKLIGSFLGYARVVGFNSEAINLLIEKFDVQAFLVDLIFIPIGILFLYLSRSDGDKRLLSAYIEILEKIDILAEEDNEKADVINGILNETGLDSLAQNCAPKTDTVRDLITKLELIQSVHNIDFNSPISKLREYIIKRSKRGL